jgi:hypothetical protein
MQNRDDQVDISQFGLRSGRLIHQWADPGN